MAYGYYIFDKDGTLVQSESGKEIVTKVQDQRLIPGVLDRLEAIREENPDAVFLIASNQGGVAFGQLTIRDASTLVTDAVQKIGGSLGVFAPEHPKGTVEPFNVESEFRKPGPGMINFFIEEIGAPRSAFLMVGDSEEDRLAAGAAGIDFRWADEFFGRGNGPQD